MASSQVIADSYVVIIEVIHCSTVQGERGARLIFIGACLTLDVETCCFFGLVRQWLDHDFIRTNGASFPKRRRRIRIGPWAYLAQLLIIQGVKSVKKIDFHIISRRGGFEASSGSGVCDRVCV
jgi:hypothetical protein